MDSTGVLKSDPNPDAHFADGGARCLRPGLVQREGIYRLLGLLQELDSLSAAADLE